MRSDTSIVIACILNLSDTAVRSQKYTRMLNVVKSHLYHFFSNMFNCMTANTFHLFMLLIASQWTSNRLINSFQRYYVILETSKCSLLFRHSTNHLLLAREVEHKPHQARFSCYCMLFRSITGHGDREDWDESIILGRASKSMYISALRNCIVGQSLMLIPLCW